MAKFFMKKSLLEKCNRFSLCSVIAGILLLSLSSGCAKRGLMSGNKLTRQVPIAARDNTIVTDAGIRTASADSGMNNGSYYQQQANAQAASRASADGQPIGIPTPYRASPARQKGVFQGFRQDNSSGGCGSL